MIDLILTFYWVLHDIYVNILAIIISKQGEDIEIKIKLNTLKLKRNVFTHYLILYPRCP